jgi:hypothetical protein
MKAWTVLFIHFKWYVHCALHLHNHDRPHHSQAVLSALDLK